MQRQQDEGIKIPPSQLVDIAKVKVHPTNVKEHPEKQIKNLMQLIKWVGFKDPIVLDKNLNVKAGHGRLIAAERLGMTQIPYVLLEGLTKKQMDLFIYMDNQINESPWIKENVELLLKEIPMKDLEMFEVDWDGVRKPEYAEETEEIPEPPVTPKSKLGDVYQLGTHRIMCGDSTDKKNIVMLLDGVKSVATVTDPPYSVDYENQRRTKTALTEKEKGQAYREPENTQEFLTNFINAIPNDLLVLTYPFNKNFQEFAHAVKDWEMMYECIWLRDNFNFIIGRRYQPQHEPILILRKKGTTPKMYVPSDQSTIFQTKKVKINDLHPTMKPVELYTKLITYNSKKNEIIFEPFLGSGTTLLACEQTQRICYGIEREPAYIDVIIQRWENYTGKKAVKL